MSKVAIAADASVQLASGMVASAAGAGALLATVTDIALAVFGVPLQSVLAAACGAFGARTFHPTTSYRRAMMAGLMWTAMGIFSAQLVLAGISALWGVAVPQGALSGAAMAAAGLGQWVITADNIEKARAAIGRLLDNIGIKP